MTRIDGAAAIVTGGASGIGRGIAERLLASGARVAIADISAETVERVAAEIGAHPVVVDVSKLDDVRRMADEVVAALGGVDIVVNNAAAARSHLGGIGTIPDEEWLDALDLNYLSAVRVTNALLPALHEAGAGSAIVNISSGSSLLPNGPMAHYAAAKAALNAYGKALAGELAPAGIRVATVLPGNVLTPGADRIRQTFADAGGVSLADTTAAVPLGRPGDPRDIAEAVAYLVSDRAQWVTGATLVVDGGELPIV